MFTASKRTDSYGAVLLFGGGVGSAFGITLGTLLLVGDGPLGFVMGAGFKIGEGTEVGIGAASGAGELGGGTGE